MATQPRNLDMSTREHLIDTAESLFLSQGVDEVSLRAIVRGAGQKNPSALQYHFGNREGLIEAIVARRFRQQEARRAELLREAAQQDHLLTLREICSIQAGAPFMLCREDTTFRDVLGVFGLRLLTTDYDYFSVEPSQDTPSLLELWKHGLRSLEHLPPEVLALRIENAHQELRRLGPVEQKVAVSW